MVSTWPLKVTVRALDASGPVRLEHLVDVVRRRIQIAPLHVRVHVEHRPDVQLRGDHGNRFAAEGRQIQQQLPLHPAAPDPAFTGMVSRSCDDLMR